MQPTLATKQKIYEYLSEKLRSKMLELIELLDSAVESRNKDTKSSAGDKHETSRALAQIEIDKLHVQLSKIQQSQAELGSVPYTAVHTIVELGSLVCTSQENYFISIGYEKMVIDETIFYAVSLVSPLAQNLYHKKAGDTILFNGREIKILTII